MVFGELIGEDDFGKGVGEVGVDPLICDCLNRSGSGRDDN